MAATLNKCSLSVIVLFQKINKKNLSRLYFWSASWYRQINMTSVHPNLGFLTGFAAITAL